MNPQADELALRLAAQEAVARILSESSGLADATPRLLEAIGETLGWQLGALFEVDRESERLRCVETWSAPGIEEQEFERLTRHPTFPAELGLPGRVLASGEPLWVADVLGDRRFLRTGAAAAAGLRGWIAFPTRSDSGILGVIEFFAREVRQPDEGVLQTMSAFGSQIGQYMERRRAEEAVRESEARKSAVLESALDGVITIDHRGRILEFNPAAERIFGYRRADAVGKVMADLIIPPFLRERHHRGLAHYLRTGEGPLLDKRIEITGMRADGSEFPVELAITRIALDGPPTFSGYVRDISQRKREERAQGFLSDSSKVLATSLDFKTTLESVARLAVPAVADWCAVDVLERGTIRNFATMHVDPAKVELAAELRRRYPPDPHAPRGVANVLRTGVSEHYPEVPDELLEGAARDAEHLERLRGLGLASAVVVPMVARGRTHGAITLVASESGRRFDEHDLALAEELGRRAGVAVDNARLYSERSYIARTLQESLLPAEIPEIAGLEVAARYRAVGEANEVGGDFYDVFETDPSEWVFVIGDVSGKGARAAAVTALARYTLRTAAFQEKKPNRVLARLNDAMVRQCADDDFCTIAYARLQQEPAPLRLTVARGGHPPPIVLRAEGRAETVASAGIPLGVAVRPTIEERGLDLSPGDAIVLYTDGVTEARTRSGRMFGSARLMSLVESCAGAPAPVIAHTIEQAVLEAQDGEPRDDIAIVVLRATADGEAGDGAGSIGSGFSGAVQLSEPSRSQQ
ncbi:MAG: SpoIIE family protein phosphatase [Actinomycetota bacterium]|nr:SpoIIE family protein phosphatase [Actinomycetota bacterium]